MEETEQVRSRLIERVRRVLDVVGEERLANNRVAVLTAAVELTTGRGRAEDARQAAARFRIDAF